MKRFIVIGGLILISLILLGLSNSGVKSVSVAPDHTTYSAPKVIPTPAVTSTPTPTIEPTLAPTSIPDSGLSNDKYYINSNGNEVHSPAYSNTVPDGATAICGDGTYSFSQHRRGTCSHHGGVAQWL